MKRWSSFAIAAVVTFGLTFVGTVRANWFVNATPAGTCRIGAGLPQVGQFGEYYTNSESQPVGNTYYGVVFCDYQDHVVDDVTGAFVPPISLVSLTVYAGDGRYDPWGLNRYDVRAALCAQDFYQYVWWCSPSSMATSGTGWQNITFHGTYSGWDMPAFWNDRGWADPLGGFSKIVYVYLPQMSKFTGWMVYNYAG